MRNLKQTRRFRHDRARGMERLESRQMFSADLVGSAFDVTGGQPLPGGEVDATFTVKNQNGFWFLDDAGPFKVYVYLSSDSTIAADDLLIGSTSFTGLGAGQSVSRTIPLAVPLNDPFLSTNDYRIGMIIDPDNTVGESNESNNANQGSVDGERVWFERDVLHPASFIPDCQNLPIGGTVSGTIGGTDERMGALDIDAWQFTPAPGQTIAFDLDAGPGLISDIRLIQLNNGQYTENHGGAAPGEPTGTGDSLIRWTFPFNIPCFIAVSALGNNTSNPCYLTGRSPASQGSYTLSAVVIPAAPSAPTLAWADDTGISGSDNVTKTTTLHLNFNGQPGKIGQIYVDGTLRGSDSNPSAAGSYSIAVSGLSDGKHTITAALLDPSSGYVSNLSAPLSVTVDTTPPAVAVPDLASASDSGSSSSDNITNDSTPTFVGTTEALSRVDLYQNGNYVQSVTAAADGSWSVTPTFTTDGSYSMTVRALDAAGNMSPASPALSFTLDTAGPTLTSPMTFAFETAPQKLTMVFSDDVLTTLASPDLTVIDLASSGTVGATLAYDQPSHAATFTLAPNVLARGNYRATISSSGVTDIAGNGVSGDTTLDFFFLPGDANHDRSVDVSDLGILATNWQASGRTFSQGDLNYDGFVDVSDLGILATNWQNTLPASTATTSVGSTASASKPRLSSRQALVAEVLA